MKLSTLRISFALSALALVLVAPWGSESALANPPTKLKHATPTYKEVDAILQAKCVQCHNDTRAAQGVNLTTFDKLMKGGKGGPIVVAGKPKVSDLLLYVDGTKKPRMPLGGKPPLEKKEIDTIKGWIKAGAKAPTP